jgi:DNA-binding XRE family transcriptional regulator
MSNVGTVLREEICRLSRRESRSQVDPTKKTTAQHRRAIAALKRQVAVLERQVKLLSRKVLGSSPAVPSDPIATTRVRFVAKGLRSQRNRLGLSAAAFGKLVGVSAQSIYNWERELAHPRGEQRLKLASLRGIGKRQAAERLKPLRSGKDTIRRKT